MGHTRGPTPKAYYPGAYPCNAIGPLLEVKLKAASQPLSTPFVQKGLIPRVELAELSHPPGMPPTLEGSFQEGLADGQSDIGAHHPGSETQDVRIVVPPTHRC